MLGSERKPGKKHPSYQKGEKGGKNTPPKYYKEGRGKIVQKGFFPSLGKKKGKRGRGEGSRGPDVRARKGEKQVKKSQKSSPSNTSYLQEKGGKSVVTILKQARW